MSFVLFLLSGGLSLYSYFHEWSLLVTIVSGLVSLLSFLFFLAKHRVLGDAVAEGVDSLPDDVDFDIDD